MSIIVHEILGPHVKIASICDQLSDHEEGLVQIPCAYLTMSEMLSALDRGLQQNRTMVLHNLYSRLTASSPWTTLDERSVQRIKALKALIGLRGLEVDGTIYITGTQSVLTPSAQVP